MGSVQKMKMLIAYGAYLALASMVTFWMMAYDKRQAKRKGRRIPEKKLLLYGLAGGAAGQWLSMHFLRHKTQHKNFVWSVPLFAFLHAMIGVGIAYVSIKGGIR